MSMTTIRDRIAYERTFSLRERWHRLKEKCAIFIAWNLLPALVRKWVVVRTHAACTTGENSHVHPGDVKAFDLYRN